MSAKAHEKADDLGPQIDAMLADAEHRAESAPEPSAPEHDDFQSELHGAVGEAEARAVSAARRAAQATHAPSPSTAQPSPASIDELDAQLAEAAPDEADLPPPTAPAPADQGPAQTLEAMREEVAQALAAAPMQDEEPAPGESPQSAPPEPDDAAIEPGPQQPPAVSEPAAVEPEPEPERLAPDPEPESVTAEPKPTRASPLLALLRAVPVALAWPLSFLPPAARDQVGWLALVTLFNAGAVWVYLLLKH